MFESFNKTKVQRVETDESEKTEPPFDPERDITEKDLDDAAQVLKEFLSYFHIEYEHEQKLPRLLGYLDHIAPLAVFLKSFKRDSDPLNGLGGLDITFLLDRATRKDNSDIYLNPTVAYYLSKLLPKQTINRCYIRGIHSLSDQFYENSLFDKRNESSINWHTVSDVLDDLRSLQSIEAKIEFVRLAALIRKQFPEKIEITETDWKMISESIEKARTDGKMVFLAELALNAKELWEMSAPAPKPEGGKMPLPPRRKF